MVDEQEESMTRYFDKDIVGKATVKPIQYPSQKHHVNAQLIDKERCEETWWPISWRDMNKLH